MEEVFEAEKLNCIRNEMTHLWGSIFATSGGVIALVLSEFNILKLFFYNIWDTVIISND